MKKYVGIDLDKARNLRFGMVALMKIEEKLGKSFQEIDFQGSLKYKDLSVIIWGGLVHEDANLTPLKVAELIDEYSDMQTVTEKMTEAMELAFGKKQAGTAEEQESNGDGN